MAPQAPPKAGKAIDGLRSEGYSYGHTDYRHG